MWFDTFISGAPVWHAECWKPRPGAGQSTCGRITKATWVLPWRHPNQTQQGCSSSATSSFFFFKITIQPYKHKSSSRISSVQSLSCVQLFVTSWTAARQASLSITSSCSLLKLMSKESVMAYNHLILCRPLLLPPSVIPSIRVFSNELVLPSGGQSIVVSASASVPSMNIQDWLPLGRTG